MKIFLPDIVQMNISENIIWIKIMQIKQVMCLNLKNTTDKIIQYFFENLLNKKTTPILRRVSAEFH